MIEADLLTIFRLSSDEFDETTACSGLKKNLGSGEFRNRLSPGLAAV
jgi:hypothetical protein